MKNNKATIANKFRILILLVVVATLSLGVYMYKGVEVSLEVDGKESNIVSYAETVEEFIQKEDIHFDEGAYINTSLDAKLEDNTNIIIKNLKSYHIDDNGSVTKVESIHNTVEEILAEQDINLNDGDYTYPKLKESVEPNGTIRLFRIRQETIVEEIITPHEKIITKNRDLDVGTNKIIQEGKDGIRKKHIYNFYVNDELVISEVRKDEVVQEVSNHIVEKGTRDTINTSRGNTRYKKAITMNASAYDLSFASTGKRPGDRHYGITASGTRVKPGCVAVDPRVIPLGTKLYIKSLDGTKDYGFAVAEDKGGAIKGNKIDLFFESSTAVKNFGRRNVKVFILD